MISQSGPQRYISDEKAYDALPKFINDLKVNKVLFLHGTKSLNAAKEYLPNFGENINVTDVLFNGECSYPEINRIKKIVAQNHIQMIIGLGGGKVLDTAKSVKAGTRLYLVVIPTLASNCAPWSALSVHYKENGEHLDHIIYPETSNLLLLNPKVILNSPIDYFIAGIADTLAKFYEPELMFDELPTDQYTVALTISHQMAIKCRDTLLKYSVGAVQDMKSGNLSHTWRTVAETIIVTAGLVGGWGDAYARSTGAHSVHDALTLLPETVHLLHGDKVGYGILVQLAIEGHFEEIKNLLPFYRELGIPTNFNDLNIKKIDESTIDLLASASVDKTTMSLIPMHIDAKAVKKAMLDVENITVSV